MKNRRSDAGFTLIELMITVAIVAILAAIAYPAYTSHTVRANRAAAQAQILDLANRQQQFLLTGRAYASKTDLEGSGYALPVELSSRYDYSVSIGTATVPSFTITFTPKGSQAVDGDLTINSEGGKTGKW